jgi:aryl-alcohol dehydrogenase-like predicted oxidoreductase
MNLIPLGQSDIMVPDMCLGSMTWGTQTSQPDAHAQIDMSLDRRLNFIDTATMYPVNPFRPETTGLTEEVIGNWVQKTGRRADVIIATKHVGEGSAAVKGGSPMISSATIPEAIDASLQALKTDYIDLYQFHWPNRGSYMFRKNWTYDPSGQDCAQTLAHMADCMGALQDAVQAGKIRTFGLSNESAWGMAMWLKVANETGGPRPVTVQNEYSLLCRLYDTDLAELGVNEDIVLLAFSPLGAGMLTGKYMNGALPAASRKTINHDLSGRASPRAEAAVEAYVGVARKHGLDPTHLALAFCRQRPFPVSAIFGATTNQQLEHILAGLDVTLGDDVLADLNDAHKAHPMPY